MILKAHTFPDHFSMPECAKAHLRKSRISNFFQERTPDTPLSVRGRKAKVERGKEKGEGIKRRDGKEKEREGKRKEGNGVNAIGKGGGKGREELDREQGKGQEREGKRSNLQGRGSAPPNKIYHYH